MKYVVVYERTGTGYSAYVPDLPGCIATGRTLDLTKKRMEKAVEMHLWAIRADGDPSFSIGGTQIGDDDCSGPHFLDRKTTLS